MAGRRSRKSGRGHRLDGRSCSGSSPRKIRWNWRAARKSERPSSAWLELEPLKNVQVWRFALYYFFVFGAFVALSLWLPQYLIRVYGVDIETAGMTAAMYLVPRQRVPRLWRPSLGPLWRPPRHVLDVRRRGRCHLRPVLSAHRICRAGRSKAPLHFHMETGVVPFTVHCVRARLLHGAGQGRRLQAHPGLLSEQRRRRRRPGRHDRRARRFRAADRVRRAGRPDRHLDQLLHAAVPAGRRRAGLDAFRDPADGARRRRRGAEEAARTPGNGGDPQAGARRRAVRAPS